MELVLAFVVLLVVAWFVTVPLRRRAVETQAGERDLEARLADLEARKEAKYREIRDAQLDRAQGKLSEDDYRRLDSELRQEAIGILKALDEARAEDRRRIAGKK